MTDKTIPPTEAGIHALHSHEESGVSLHGHCSGPGADDLKAPVLDPRPVLTIRGHSGLSGDMCIAGLSVLAMEKTGIVPDSPEGDAWLDDLVGKIQPDLPGHVFLRKKKVDGIRGWHAIVDLPEMHEHRTLADVEEIIHKAAIDPAARSFASSAFQLLAQCEAEAHGVEIGEVHFHEVGALDSILDICGACELYVNLGEPALVCAPLPLADGQIHCQHGILPAPAPAALKLLKGIHVRPFPGDMEAGELVTPTALALLHALGADFGPWPAFTIAHTALVYGSRIFKDAANGTVFAIGEALRLE